MNNAVASPLKKLSKKEVRQVVYNKLSEALVDFKPLIRKKKFDGKILIATKLISDDIVKATRKSRVNGKKKSKQVVEKITIE